MAWSRNSAASKTRAVPSRGALSQLGEKEAQEGHCHSLEKEQNKNKHPSCTRRNLEWILAAISSQKWLSSVQTGCSGKWMNHRACR